jgi:hypothetical protein
MRLIIIFIVLLTVGLISRPALGHKDYEQAVGTTSDSDAQPLNMVLHYKDGIVVTDPVKLVLYDSSNAVVSETPYYRDLLVHVNAAGEAYVFAQDAGSVLFRQAWRVHQGNLVPVGSQAKCYGYAGLSAVTRHWLGYLLSLAFLVGGIWMSHSPWQASGLLRRLGEGFLSFGLLWVVLVLMYDRLSVPLILLLTAILTAPCWITMLRRVGSGKAQKCVS